MNAEIKFPKTLVEAIKYFADLDAAHDFFAKMRWTDGPVCPRCGSHAVRYMAKYRRYQCSQNHDSRQFTVKTGSVMEDSPMGLDKWAAAFWLEVNAKNSISSYELHRALGITQKSAWFMLHRIRFALKQNTFEKMGRNGIPVEADETFIGGKSKFMHKSKRALRITGGGAKDKTAVMGLLERHSEKKHSTVRAVVLEGHPGKHNITDIIRKNVEPGANVFTDSYRGYDGIKADFAHQFVDHAEAYVKGAVHTNGLENFWSLFKRCIKGTHVSVDPMHLLAYVDSEAFRFNNRKEKDTDRFLSAVYRYHGKRLSYKALIGASEGAPEADRDGESRSLLN